MDQLVLLLQALLVRVIRGVRVMRICGDESYDATGSGYSGSHSGSSGKGSFGDKRRCGCRSWSTNLDNLPCHLQSLQELAVVPVFIALRERIVADIAVEIERLWIAEIGVRNRLRR